MAKDTSRELGRGEAEGHPELHRWVLAEMAVGPEAVVAEGLALETEPRLEQGEMVEVA